jgi:hypothetical protein
MAVRLNEVLPPQGAPDAEIARAQTGPDGFPPNGQAPLVPFCRGPSAALEAIRSRLDRILICPKPISTLA